MHIGVSPARIPSPIQFKKIPRKTNQVWKSDEGEGGNAEALRGVGVIVEVPQNRSVRLDLELPRIGACESVRFLFKIGSCKVD